MALRVGLISDTHGFWDKETQNCLKTCDELWHAGDIGTESILHQIQSFLPLRAVFGNVDGVEIRTKCPEDLFFEAEGVKVWMRHIGALPPYYTSQISQKIHTYNPQLFVCGHTHILRVLKDTSAAQRLYLNPGAIGHIGAHKVRTALCFSLDQGEVKDLSVIELGKRGRTY